MTLWDEIRRFRDAGVVRCGRIDGSFDVESAARRFGLDGASIGFPADPALARRIVRYVLEFDLAYNDRIMPEAAASDLTERFAAEARLDEGAWCVTNLEYPFEEKGQLLGSWHPATTATFDTGVLVVALGYCACLWVEDED